MLITKLSQRPRLQGPFSTAVVTGNSGGYTAFPLTPREGFVTVSADF